MLATRRQVLDATPQTPEQDHQAGTCFMLSLEVWPGKPFSQVRIRDQKKTPPWLL